MFFSWNILFHFCLSSWNLQNVPAAPQLMSSSLLTDSGSADPLSSLQFVTDSVFLASCRNGNVYVADIRTSAPPQVLPPPLSGSALWWTGASADLSSCRIVRLSSSGQTVLSDLRNLGGGAVSRALVDVETHRCSADDVGVSWSPRLHGCIAVSGQFMAVLFEETHD